MPDAPDWVEEDSDTSMLDAEMADSMVDIDMVDAVSFFLALPRPPCMANSNPMGALPLQPPYEPLLCQDSPVRALPAPTLRFSHVSAAFAYDTAMEVEQEQPLLSLSGPVVVHPVSAFRPFPVVAALENTAMEAEQGGVAAAPAPIFVPVSISCHLFSCSTQLFSKCELTSPQRSPSPVRARPFSGPSSVMPPLAAATAPATAPATTHAIAPVTPSPARVNSPSQVEGSGSPEDFYRPSPPPPPSPLPAQQQVGPSPVEPPVSSPFEFSPLVEPTHPTSCDSSPTAPASAQSTMPAPIPRRKINFDYEKYFPEFPEETRRIAKPKSRLAGRRQAQASAAAPAYAPAPVLPPPGPTAPAFAEQLPVPTPATIAPQSSLAAPPSASDKGKGLASFTSPAEDEPNPECDFVVMPGEYLRSLCEDWIESCATFMETSELCASVSPRRIRVWKQQTLINLGEDLAAEYDEAEYTNELATDFVLQIFKHSILRRSDGPGSAGRNAFMQHVKQLARKEGLDLGRVDVQ